MREQVVEGYQSKNHDEILEILKKLIRDGNRIVNVVSTFRSRYNFLESDYLVVYEKSYDD